MGLQTLTQDRLMPVLLPGILELSRRGRYLSFHAFLLAEYQARRLPASSKALWTFIKRREWELGLAIQLCPQECGSSPVGARRLGRLAESDGKSGLLPRGESVDSDLGGYGLYYRSPMAELGIVAKAGTLLGGEPIPIDVLYETGRARRLAAAFKSAVEHTAYYQRAMWTDDDLPIEVIREYAAVACLCRLRERPEELAAVHDAMFGADPPTDGTHDDGQGAAGSEGTSGAPRESVVQRRRSVGHYLTLIRADPDVVGWEPAYREALWSAAADRSDGHAVVAGQWAAVIAKDVWQDAICSVWSEFCRAGLDKTRELGRGLTWDETRAAAEAMTGGPPVTDPGAPTAELAVRLASGTLTIPLADGDINASVAALEDLRQATVQLDTAASGLVVLLELARRMGQRSGAGWDQASRIASGWQPSVAAVAAGLRAHLAEDPSVADTLWWLVSRFVLPVHERIAYSKLPEYTFRFRWEDGLLRFYDHGTGRFPLAAIRFAPLGSLTWDLGFWEETGDPGLPAALTARGIAFLDEALA